MKLFSRKRDQLTINIRQRTDPDTAIQNPTEKHQAALIAIRQHRGSADLKSERGDQPTPGRP